MTPSTTTLAKLFNPIMPKMSMPLASVAAMVRFGTPVYAAMYPDVTRPTRLAIFMITS
jgi:hypothetical protein